MQTDDARAIPVGMKPWHGGDAAPADWAGPDSETLLRNGYRVKGGFRWTHHCEDHPSGTDIIAYTPATSPQPASEDGATLREAVVRIERFASMMVPLMPLYWRRNNEAAIVQMANDFADLRAALSTPANARPLSPSAVADSGEGVGWRQNIADALGAVKQAARYTAIGDGYFDTHANAAEAVDAAVDRLAAMLAASPKATATASVREEWLRGDWYEKWEDATENADDGLMATLEALRGRVERTILAALTDSSTAATKRECPSSPDGRHQVDTSMESGPNNCFHCSAPMGGTAATIGEERA